MTPQELKNSIIHIAMRGRLVEQRSNEGSAAELYKSIIEEKKAAGVKPNKKLEPVTEDVIPFEIPDSWMWVRFGDIVDYRMGKTPPREDLKWWNSDVPWVAISDMPESGHIASTKEAVSFAAIKEKFSDRVSPAGTMIMSFKLTVGRVSILDIDAVHNEAIISIFPYADKDNTIQSYLFMLLPTVTQYGDTKNAIKGKTLNATSICNLLIPLPPLSEQKRIVTKIDELLPLVERYGEAWTKLEEFNKKFPDDMKKSILQQAIQGKLVEQRPEDGTGEELYKQIQAEKQKLIKAGKLKKEKPLLEISEDEIPFEIPESWKWVRFGDVSSYAQRKEKVSAINISADMWSLDLEDIEKDTGKITNHCLACDRTISGDKVKFKTGNILYSKLRPYLKKVLVAPADGICSSEIVPFVMYGNIEPEYARYFLISPFADGIVNSASYGVKMPRVSTDTMTSLCFPLPPLAEQKRIVAKIEELLPLCEKLK